MSKNSTINTKSAGEARLLEAMNILFANHSNLLSFIFDSDQLSLRKSPEELISESYCLSSGEQTLIRVALDLWCEFPSNQLSDIVSRLDIDNFYQVIKTLIYLAPCSVNAIDSFSAN